MTSSIIQFLIAAAVIVAAGGALTQFGEIIANRSKLGALAVGGLLIAGATSLPEFAININNVRAGAANLAVGDLLVHSALPSPPERFWPPRPSCRTPRRTSPSRPVSEAPSSARCSWECLRRCRKSSPCSRQFA